MKLTVAVSRKDGRPNFSSEGATCSFELELDQAMLEKPGLLHQQIRATFATCSAAVEEQLEQPDVDEGRHGDPVRDRMNAPPPPPPLEPARHYDDRRPNGRAPLPSTPPSRNGNGSMPSTGKGLWGWIRDHRDEHPNAMGWFIGCGRKNRFADRITDWRDVDACWAFETYQDQVAATNGDC